MLDEIAIHLIKIWILFACQQFTVVTVTSIQINEDAAACPKLRKIEVHDEKMNAGMKTIDLNDDCLEHIFKHSSPTDLIYISNSNKQLK